MENDFDMDVIALFLGMAIAAMIFGLIWGLTG